MSDSENLKLWRRVEKTDPRHTKKVNSRGGFTAIDAQWQVFVATKLWGPMGSTWGVRDMEYGYVTSDGVIAEAYVEGVFFYPGGTIELSSDMLFKAGNDSRKKLRTDIITKALSQLGFSADVFMGLFDDNKYVQERLREAINEEQWEEDRVEFCRTLSALGFTYHEVKVWLESNNRPAPSGMKREIREALLNYLSDDQNRETVRLDMSGLITLQEDKRDGEDEL
tara:strand:- start:717 stop:1388 length:672 start_codon:yes stop_codon:yes gene_type:complete